ncbi:hypothetical protein NP233_g1505 [Leucocoprinus birnbaumii]|uniref:Vacuolar import and degradation protein-domain-containing protein n=1 Tax=Leucocoprinus birnbaumii TaxID=56174 RepID=A0AAD5YXX5_9AGAR|nr:hypothetical protein NP233_g1505 [Leucocoprinus birnbaumii]
MPHNFQPLVDAAPAHQQSSQPKSCPSCYALVFVPELDAPAICPNCREQVLLRAAQSQHPQRRLIDQDVPLQHSQNIHGTRTTFVNTLESPPASPIPQPSVTTVMVSPPRIEPQAEFSKPYTTPVYRIEQPPALPAITHFSPPAVSSLRQPHSREPREKPPNTVAISTPDPLADVTRIRVRTRANHCLYPGATFEGTQKSGRNSYDVTVTIVVCHPHFSSRMCPFTHLSPPSCSPRSGYAYDWPELTTYFDAEIIGSRYGFLTQNWGASENEDLVHWSRFPAFRHIKHEAKRPRLTIDDRDRGAVFMRWKEKFLVPDHRVHDINGASFAGFYYVCVDFNPAATASAADAAEQEEHRSGRKQNRNRRGSSARRTSAVKRPPSLAPYTAPVATMSGFYYHQNSEPYQQLSLTHVPETSSSSFEFR